MLNLNIDSLALTVTHAEGQEHRIRPIVARAAAIFAERAEGHYGRNSNNLGLRTVSSVDASPVSVDLRAMTDERVAQDIASAWLRALTLKFM
jgi:hypothetical protein